MAQGDPGEVGQRIRVESRVGVEGQQGEAGDRASQRGGWAIRSKRGSLLCDTPTQVLLQEPNPGIEFEFWLPRELYGPFQAQAQALGWSLRQPQPREVERQPPEPPAAPAANPSWTPHSTPGEAGMDRAWASGKVRPVSLTSLPPQTPAPPAPTPEAAPTGFSTIAAATLVRNS